MTDRNSTPNPNAASTRNQWVHRTTLAGALVILIVSGVLFFELPKAKRAKVQAALGETHDTYYGLTDEGGMLTVQKLGGPRAAARKLTWYLSLPDDGKKATEQAYFALSFCGEAAVPTFQTQLTDADRDVCWRAIKSLGAIGPPASAAVPRLNELSSSPDTMRYDAIAALVRITGSTDRLHELTDALGSQAYPARLCASRALSHVGPLAVQIMPELKLWLLKDTRSSDDDKVRCYLVRTFGRMGPSATGAVPELVQVLHKTGDFSVAKEIIRALGQIGGQEAHETLNELATKDQFFKVLVARSLELSRSGDAAVKGSGDAKNGGK